jgi:YfiH family protein
MTTRQGGVSRPPWDSLNLGDHVGDEPSHVATNRRLVAQTLQAQAVYVKQVHGVTGWELSLHSSPTLSSPLPEADLTWTTQPGLACAMMVADCLPLLVCHRHTPWVAAVHAGWRGLAGSDGHGVVESLRDVVQQQGLAPQDCLVWLGPCIGPTAFEVGSEVVAALSGGLATPSDCFKGLEKKGQYLADLAAVARFRLRASGFCHLFGNDSSLTWCTFRQEALYHSHRRDALRKGGAGRMAAIIWLAGGASGPP